MANQIVILLLACCICHVYSAATTSKPPRTTIPYYDHSESSQINFIYEPSLNHFIARTGSTCFIVTLTHDEQDHVHSSRGLGDIELKMLREWVGVLPETRIFHDDFNLPELTKKFCYRKEIFLLIRPDSTSQGSSVLG